MALSELAKMDMTGGVPSNCKLGDELPSPFRVATPFLTSIKVLLSSLPLIPNSNVICWAKVGILRSVFSNASNLRQLAI